MNLSSRRRRTNSSDFSCCSGFSNSGYSSSQQSGLEEFDLNESIATHDGDTLVKKIDTNRPRYLTPTSGKDRQNRRLSPRTKLNLTSKQRGRKLLDDATITPKHKNARKCKSASPTKKEMRLSRASQMKKILVMISPSSTPKKDGIRIAAVDPGAKISPKTSESPHHIERRWLSRKQSSRRSVPASESSQSEASGPQRNHTLMSLEHCLKNNSNEVADAAYVFSSHSYKRSKGRSTSGTKNEHRKGIQNLYRTMSSSRSLWSSNSSRSLQGEDINLLSIHTCKTSNLRSICGTDDQNSNSNQNLSKAISSSQGQRSSINSMSFHEESRELLHCHLVKLEKEYEKIDRQKAAAIQRIKNEAEKKKREIRMKAMVCERNKMMLEIQQIIDKRREAHKMIEHLDNLRKKLQSQKMTLESQLKSQKAIHKLLKNANKDGNQVIYAKKKQEAQYSMKNDQLSKVIQSYKEDIETVSKSISLQRQSYEIENRTKKHIANGIHNIICKVIEKENEHDSSNRRKESINNPYSSLTKHIIHLRSKGIDKTKKYTSEK